MILYGRNPVAEALRGRRAHTVQEVWAGAGALREPWLKRAQARGVRVRAASAAGIERRCGSAAHQGVCAEAGAYPYVPSTALLACPEPLVLALDQVQDPHNLGSICRTAAEVTPAVCKASAGAVEHLAVAQVRNVADFLAEARGAGCWCYGASPRARASGPQPVPYDVPDYRGSGIVLVLGGEASGLRPRVAGACDQLICLPLLGQSESLGVAAAAAALVYGILQRRAWRVDKNP